MKDAERKQAEERLAELERVAIAREADEIFKRNETEKVVRRRKEAENVAVFRINQAVSVFINNHHGCAKAQVFSFQTTKSFNSHLLYILSLMQSHSILLILIYNRRRGLVRNIKQDRKHWLRIRRM